MKKKLHIALFTIMVLALLAGCQSAPKQQTDAPSSVTAAPPPTVPTRSVNYKITDWQGASLGRAVPEWVDYASDRRKEPLSKALGLDGKELYIYTEAGADLDMIRVNTQINSFAQIATQIKSGVAVAGGNRLAGSKDDDASKQQSLEIANAIAAQIVISGFTLDVDFWQKRQYPDGKQDIEYYAVYTIGAEELKHQIDLALGKIDAKTQAEREAKEAIRAAVMEAKSLLE